MTWGDWLICAMAIQCLLAAVFFGMAGKWPQAVAFTGYVIANVGLLWMSIWKA